MEVMSRLEGAFALLIKSTHYPDQLVAAKRGSPLIMGLASQQVGCQSAGQLLQTCFLQQRLLTGNSQDLLLAAAVEIEIDTVYACIHSKHAPHVYKLSG